MSESGMAARPSVVVVLGPWSSGTSAVAGALGALGANLHPPTFATNDERVSESFESLTLRQIICPLIDEATLTRRQAPPWTTARLRVWAGPGPSVAKIPVLAFFLPEILRAWSARFVIVRRDLDAIEATRIRRGWGPIYGRAGAERIYDEIASSLPKTARQMEIDFDRFREDPLTQGGALAAFVGLLFDGAAIQRAVSL